MVESGQRRSRWIEGLVYSNALMLFLPVAMALGNYALLGLPPSWAFLSVLSAGTFILYQIDRGLFVSSEDLANKPGRVEWSQRHRMLAWLATLGAVGLAVAGGMHLPSRTLWAVAAMGVVGFSYVLPILPGQKRFKDVPYAKAFVVGLTWAFSCTVIPAFNAGRAWDGFLAGLFFYRVGWVLPNLLLSNWFDREGDRAAGIRTFAWHISEAQMLLATRAVLVVAALGAFVAVFAGAVSRLWIVDAAGLLAMLTFLGRGLPASPWFFLLVIDLGIAWPIVTALIHAR